MSSLGEDTFGGGVWRRLSGSYPRCGNRRALQIMRDRKITQLIVEDNGRYAGMLHIHDCLRAGVA